jgi:hypothetical protein
MATEDELLMRHLGVKSLDELPHESKEKVEGRVEELRKEIIDKENEDNLPSQVNKESLKEVEHVLSIPKIIYDEIRKQIAVGIKEGDKVVELFQRLDGIKEDKELEVFIEELDSLQVKVDFVKDFYNFNRNMLGVDGIADIPDVKIDSRIYELLLRSIGNKDIGAVYVNIPLTEDEVISYTGVLWVKEKKLIVPLGIGKTIKGKVISQEWMGKKTLYLAIGYEKHEEGDIVVKRMMEFYNEDSDKRGLRGWVEVCKVKLDYYGYRFWSEEEEREYLLLTSTKLKTEDDVEIYQGTHIKKSDVVKVSGDSKISSYKEFFHIVNIPPRPDIMYRVHHTCVSGGISADVAKNIHTLLFNRFKHPFWFEKFIVSFLLSTSKIEYPLHLFIFQNGGGGKTTLLHNIARIMGIKPSSIWSGNNSTIKSLTPSFKNTPPEIGWCAKQKILGLLDEFFGRQSSKDVSDTLYEYDSLKNILEKNPSAALSASGNIEINITAQFLFSSNLKYGISDLQTFMDRTDPALVERMLVYFMNTDHEQFVIKQKEDVKLQEDIQVDMPIEHLRDIITWSKSFTIKNIDGKRIRTIKNNLKTKIKTFDTHKYTSICDYIDARLDHHLFALLDGYVKYRYIMASNITLDMTPIEDDYIELEQTMEIIALSWVNNFNIKDFSLDARVRMLSGYTRDIYHFIREMGGKSIETDVVAYVNDVLKIHSKDAGTSINQLIELEIICQKEGFFYCFWRDEVKGIQPTPTSQTGVKTINIEVNPKQIFEKIIEPHDGVCDYCGFHKWLEFTHGGHSMCRQCSEEEGRK